MSCCADALPNTAAMQAAAASQAEAVPAATAAAEAEATADPPEPSTARKQNLTNQDSTSAQPVAKRQKLHASPEQSISQQAAYACNGNTSSTKAADGLSHAKHTVSMKRSHGSLPQLSSDVVANVVAGTDNPIEDDLADSIAGAADADADAAAADADACDHDAGADADYHDQTCALPETQLGNVDLASASPHLLSKSMLQGLQHALQDRLAQYATADVASDEAALSRVKIAAERWLTSASSSASSPSW